MTTLVAILIGAAITAIFAALAALFVWAAGRNRTPATPATEPAPDAAGYVSQQAEGMNQRGVATGVMRAGHGLPANLPSTRGNGMVILRDDRGRLEGYQRYDWPAEPEPTPTPAPSPAPTTTPRDGIINIAVGNLTLGGGPSGPFVPADEEDVRRAVKGATPTAAPTRTITEPPARRREAEPEEEEPVAPLRRTGYEPDPEWERIKRSLIRAASQDGVWGKLDENRKRGLRTLAGGIAGSIKDGKVTAEAGTAEFIEKCEENLDGGRRRPTPTTTTTTPRPTDEGAASGADAEAALAAAAGTPGPSPEDENWRPPARRPEVELEEPTPAPDAGTPTTDGRADREAELMGKSVKDVQEIGRELKIRGRSGMDRAKLAKATLDAEFPAATPTGTTDEQPADE